MVHMPAATAAVAPNRVLSIDVLRGITIAFMILVNDPGDGRHTYAQLEHAPWNGFTLTDLVFPNFLFLVGASIILSQSTRMERGDPRGKLARNIVRRAATIFLLDLFLTAAPYFHLTTLRIYGVLTRIAVCYLVVGLLCLVSRRIAVLASMAVAILLGYWILMRFVPVPGFGIPTHDIPLLDPDRNLAAFLDRAITAFLQRTVHTGRLYEHTRDPEGLLSTLPSIATTLLGAITALWLRRPTTPASTPTTQNLSSRPEAQSAAVEGPAFSPGPQSLSSRPERSAVEGPASPTPTPNTVISTEAEGAAERPLYFAPASTQPTPQTKYQTLRGLFIASATCLAAGRLWNQTFPINKNLWTSSYVLFAAGCSLLGLALCFWLVDILRLQHRSRLGRALLWPWLVFGSNAITAFAVSVLLVKTLILIKVHDSWNPNPDVKITAWNWIYRHLFSRGVSTENTSLAFALAFVALCFLPNLLLWRKRIFLKV